MKGKIIRISVLLVLLLSMLASASPQEVNGTVTYVVDGDTIHVQISGYDSRIGNITVRLADVDCPEVGTASGPCSRQFAHKELNGSVVSLDLDDKTGKDRYGRWVAVVYLLHNGNLTNFNKMLVDTKNGCICDYQNNEFDPREWWNGTHPATACRAESSINETFCPTVLSFNNKCSDGPVTGNRATHKYHYPCCPRAQEMSLSNAIWFISSEAARAQGYLPCEVCSSPAQSTRVA